MILPEYREKLADMERKRDVLATAWFVANKELDRLCKWGEALFGPNANEEATRERKDQLNQFIDEAKAVKEQSIKVREDSAKLKRDFEALMEANEATVEAMKLTGTPLPEEGV